MNEKQVAVLQRIIRRETARQEVHPERPRPGLHPSGDKSAITDGEICVFLCHPVDGLPEGDRMDSLANIVERELYLGTHLRLPDTVVAPQFWRNLQTKRSAREQPSLELSAHKQDKQVATRFKAQLLLDAVGVVGSSVRMDLEYGRFTNAPTLLVRQLGWAEKDGTGPVVLILPDKEGVVL